MGARDAMEVTQEEFRETFSSVPAPVAIITASHDGSPHGATVSSFCSLSADPPMVLVALDRLSNTLPVILETRRFGVNVLAAGQENFARACAQKAKDKFEYVWWRLEQGVPRLDATAAWLACTLEDVVPGGDHLILTGRVIACAATDGEPLIYYRRTYRPLMA